MNFLDFMWIRRICKSKESFRAAVNRRWRLTIVAFSSPRLQQLLKNGFPKICNNWRKMHALKMGSYQNSKHRDFWGRGRWNLWSSDTGIITRFPAPTHVWHQYAMGTATTPRRTPCSPPDTFNNLRHALKTRLTFMGHTFFTKITKSTRKW